MQQVKLDEASAQLPSLVDAAMRGEVVLITIDDQRTVQLVPIERSKRSRQPGSAKGLIEVADDFDEPLDEFHEYMP